MWENWVIAEAAKHNALAGSPAELFFWRTRANRRWIWSCRGNKLRAFEVKWFAGRRVSGRAFRDAYGIEAEPIRPDDPFAAVSGIAVHDGHLHVHQDHVEAVSFIPARLNVVESNLSIAGNRDLGPRLLENESDEALIVKTVLGQQDPPEQTRIGAWQQQPFSILRDGQQSHQFLQIVPHGFTEFTSITLLPGTAGLNSWQRSYLQTTETIMTKSSLLPSLAICVGTSIAFLFVAARTGGGAESAPAAGPKAGKPVKTWTLATDDTKLTIGVTSDNQLCLYELSCPAIR